MVKGSRKTKSNDGNNKKIIMATLRVFFMNQKLVFTPGLAFLFGVVNIL